MLFSLIRGSSLMEIIIYLLLFIPVFLVVISVHEMSHSLMAYALGDQSQKAEGRMTLNPLKHIDPLGTIMLLVVGFGWAKPVYVNTAALRRGGKYAGALVSFAGPLSNFILALIFYFLWTNLSVGDIFNTLLYLGYHLSLMLGLFNMIPVPPLDGFGVISPFLPGRIYYFVMAHSREISIGFFLLFMLYRTYYM